MVGRVYLAKIYFTDAIKYKLRPILIIKENSFGDLIYIPFTTNSVNKNSIKFIKEDLSSRNFNKVSYLIVDKTCTIQKSLIVKEIAKVKNEKLQSIIFYYCKFLKS